jgi:hypothetical protein
MTFAFEDAKAAQEAIRKLPKGGQIYMLKWLVEELLPD